MIDKVNGLRLAWDDAGSGLPILLIHGFPLCRTMWRPQVEALVAAGYRVITPDLRGFGESEGAEEASMEIFADDLLALLDHLGIEKAVVGGMSMGGYVLLNLLKQAPERFAAALFIVTRAGGEDAAGRDKRNQLATLAREVGAAPIADAFSSAVFAETVMNERPQLVAEVRGWMEQTSPQGLIGGLMAIRDRDDSSNLLPNLHLPALVIGADADNAIPLAESQKLAAALPQASLVTLVGGGHMVNLEQP